MADANAQVRKNIHIGDTVDIVLKKDQPTGKLTRGIVGRILTNSSQHYRGIKVMLADGQVGRVQHIIGKEPELWDLYDEKFNIVGEHRRGDPIPEGRYHLVVHAWLRNIEGKYLISQRAADRPTSPLMWECVGGSVLKGEDSFSGAIREVFEEIGVNLSGCSGKLVYSAIREAPMNDIIDAWLFEYDGEVNLKKASTREVAQSKWMSAEEVMAMLESGEMVQSLAYFSQIQREDVTLCDAESC